MKFCIDRLLYLTVVTDFHITRYISDQKTRNPNVSEKDSFSFASKVHARFPTRSKWLGFSLLEARVHLSALPLGDWKSGQVQRAVFDQTFISVYGGIPLNHLPMKDVTYKSGLYKLDTNHVTQGTSFVDRTQSSRH